MQCRSVTATGTSLQGVYLGSCDPHAEVCGVMLIFFLLMNSTSNVFGHCDTLEGPVIIAAKKAPENNDVNLVLTWVQKDDEPEIRKAFEKTMAVRKTSKEAMELADMYFFETLVRIHRAGEGAPYTGINEYHNISML